jgi:hypothetical protein
MNDQYYQTFAVSSTEAGRSWIGTATPVDYNLGNIQKNWVLFFTVTVGTQTANEPTPPIQIPTYDTPQLERAKQIWGAAPAGRRLSEIVADQRS